MTPGRPFVFEHPDLPISGTLFTTPVDVFSIRISEIEGSVTEVEIVRKRSGWQTLQQAAKKAIVVAWSPTGLVAQSQAIAIGRLAEVPGDLFSPTQTLRYHCQTADVRKRMLAYAKQNLAEGPATNLLFDDADAEDPDSYLLGRTRVYRIDPITHQVSTYDEIVGDRIVDLSDLALASDGRMSDKPGLYEPPKKTLRAEVGVEWTQEANGEVDIGSQIGHFYSLDPNVSGNLGSYVVFQNGEGWSAIGGKGDPNAQDVDSGRQVGYRTVDVGSRYRIYRSRRVHNPRSFEDRNGNQVTLDSVETRLDQFAGGPAFDELVGNVLPGFKYFRHEVESFAVGFSYAQPRSEMLFAALDCPVPAFVQSPNVYETDLEPDYVFGLKSLDVDPSIPEYEIGVEYVAGDLVRRLDRYYECLADHLSEAFDQPRPVAPGTSPSLADRTYWKRVFPEGVSDLATMTRFWDSPRGEAAAQHVMLRLRKAALRRLRMRHVVLTYRWQDASHVRLQDSVRFLIDWGDGTRRPVTGKVFSIERTWDGLSNPLIVIEAAVSFGRGDFLPEPVEIDHDVTVYTLPGARVVSNVDVSRLTSASYVARSVEIINAAGDQLEQVSTVAAAGRPVTDVSVLHPTTIAIELPRIVAEGTLHRDLDILGILDATPGGVEL